MKQHDLSKNINKKIVTPYLNMNLSGVTFAYSQFRRAFPEAAVHYAMKCNPDRALLGHLGSLGSKFEIASYGELKELINLGVDPREVLFSNPVKTIEDIKKSHKVGLYRYCFDSLSELEKLAKFAKGSSVYVRLATSPADSLVHSEGKFGVSYSEAEKLIIAAKNLGLKPYGAAFHVGSQMDDPAAWAREIKSCGQLMSKLQKAGIKFKILDIGGGFPAAYDHPVTPVKVFGDKIAKSIDDFLPYKPQIVLEPGRALVAEAGTMVAAVIGIAKRGNNLWAHLDIGAFNGMMESLETNNQLRFPISDSKSSINKRLYNLTGPSCDSQDTILYGVNLSDNLQVGDRVYIHSAGAYTTAYASRFNGFKIPKVYCVSEIRSKIRQLESINI